MNKLNEYVLRNIETNEIIDLNNVSITTSPDTFWATRPMSYSLGSVHRYININGEEIGELVIPDQNDPYRLLINGEMYSLEKNEQYTTYDPNLQCDKEWINLLLEET